MFCVCVYVPQLTYAQGCAGTYRKLKMLLLKKSSFSVYFHSEFKINDGK